MFERRSNRAKKKKKRGPTVCRSGTMGSFQTVGYRELRARAGGRSRSDQVYLRLISLESIKMFKRFLFEKKTNDAAFVCRVVS